MCIAMLGSCSVQLSQFSHLSLRAGIVGIVAYFVFYQITFELTVKQLMSFDPDEWTENLRKEYMLVIEGFFTLPFPLFSTTYRRAIKARRKVAEALTVIVRQRRTESETEKKNNDMLGALLASGEHFSDEEIVDFMLALLVIERKGLDIVRHDWSLLAKDLGDFCLTQILSGGSCEDVVESIHNSLMKVETKKFGLFANWQREYTMEDILTQLKKEMAAPPNRKLVQAPEGTYF